MRAALWSRTEEAGEMSVKADSTAEDLENKLAALKHSLVEEISGILRVDQPERRALDDAVETTLRRTAQASISEQLVGARTAIRARLERPDASLGVAAAALMTSVANDYPFSVVVLAINQMRRSGELNWSGAELRPTTTVNLTRKARA
jgi:hypothetical protein